MKKGIEAILHGLHIIYEALKNIGIALAKTLGITGKSRMLLTRKIVLISLVVISASAVGLSEAEIITVQDGPYINPQLPAGFYNTDSSGNVTKVNITIPPNSKLCSNCSGTGKIKESYSVNEWVPCIVCQGQGYSVHIYDQGEMREYVGCTNCGGSGNSPYLSGITKGTGGHSELRTYVKEVICPVCGGKGYIPA